MCGVLFPSTAAPPLTAPCSLPCLGFLFQAGLHQLIMQQTFTQLPPGLAPPYGQQLGLSASWLGPPPAPPPSAPQSMPQSLAAFSSMQQHMTSQLAGALPAWAALLQPAGMPGVPPAGGHPLGPIVASASAPLDFGAATTATAALGGAGATCPAPSLPSAGERPPACRLQRALWSSSRRLGPTLGISHPAPSPLLPCSPTADVRMMQPSAAEHAAPAPPPAAPASGGRGSGTLAGHKRTHSPRPSGEALPRPVSAAPPPCEPMVSRAGPALILELAGFVPRQPSIRARQHLLPSPDCCPSRHAP